MISTLLGPRMARRLAALGMLCAASLATAGQVTTTLDDGSAGSLRNQVGAGGTITFAASLNGLTISVSAGEIVVPPGATITGPGANLLGISAGSASRIFRHTTGSASISGLTLGNGSVGAGGQGGAMYNAATLSLTNVAVTGSHAGDAGGAIYNTGSLTITGSTFNGNGVTDSTCAGGGAIRSEGAGSALNVTNSTVTGNTAASCSGGGISFNEGTATLTASTIAGNSAGASGGNLYKGSSAASLTLAADIIAQGSSGGGTPVNADVHGAIAGLVSSGYNLVQSRGDSAGYIASDLADGTAALLGALALNSGATQTLALQLASPARDAMAAACAVATDQRGFSRPQGASCDIGAFEYRINALVASVSGNGSVSAGASPAPLAGGIVGCTGACTAQYDGEAAPTVTLAATPAAGQRFSGWSGDCSGTQVTASVVMNAPRQCVATFVPDVFTVTPGVGTGNGTINPSTPQSVQAGANASFTLSPAANWHIATVGGTCGGTLSGNTFTTAAVSADCSVVANFAIDTHTVTPGVTGGNGSISPSSPQVVDHGSVAQFSLAPAANYHVANVGGTCGGNLAGNLYTTAAVTADCTVVASFAIDTHTVTPGVSGGNGSIAPSTPQSVDHGATTQFTLAPAANYHVSGVAGTCGGALAGNVYTTAAVTADCSVIASFAIDTHTVTPSVSGGNGSIAPSTPQSVDHGATTQFTLAPAANYHVANVVGSCGGSLSGNTFTTAAVTADCSVVASFAIDTHTVTPSVSGGNGSIAPSTPQSVNHGATTQFTLTPAQNYHVSGVAGTCGGALAGNVYTTAAVTADCSVIASFAIDTHMVTPSVNGGNGSIAPSTPQSVDHGATTQFTLSPAQDHHIASVDGSCGGTLAGNVFTTAAITADCTVIASFAIDTHTVTPSVNGGNGSITPSTPQNVDHGATTQFTLTPAQDHHVANVAGTCGGTLAGNVYTTAAITADCTVIASFAIDTHTVTPGVNGSHGTIAPSTPQSVDHGATTVFTLTPDTGYHVMMPMGGTCPAGTLAGNAYTTGAIIADCTVVASFAIDTHVVTPSVAGSHGTIAPSTPQTVDYDATTTFTLTPDTGYHIATPVGGTCPAGTLAGSVYTTGAITADCTVVATFAIDTHVVTPSVSGSHGTIAPSTPQTVDYGATTPFTLTPDTGYHVVTPVGGTCPAGTLAGNTYTTGAITADCTVVASFAIDTHVVTPSVAGSHGTIAPSTPQTVDYGATTPFTLTPDTGYHIVTPVGGSCPAGTLAGNVYTTGAIIADCTVIAGFAVDTHTIGGTVAGLVGSGLVLQLNGGNDLAIAANGVFTFAQPLDDFSTYAVTVSQQPGAPVQACTVANGSGTLSGNDVTDVAVTCAPPSAFTLVISDSHDFARYGTLLNYLVTLSNNGGDASGVTVTGVIPPQLDAAATQWVCLGGSGGATCGNGGSGGFNDVNVSIPAGRSISWLVTAPVLAMAPGATVDFPVSASGPASATATDEDILVILRSGFQLHDDGASQSGADGAHCAAGDADAQAFDPAQVSLIEVPPPAAATIDTLFAVRGTANAGFRVERLGLGDAPRVRLIAVSADGSEQASAWSVTRVGAQVAVAIAEDGRTTSVLLEGGVPSLTLALPAPLPGALHIEPAIGCR